MFQGGAEEGSIEVGLEDSPSRRTENREDRKISRTEDRGRVLVTEDSSRVLGTEDRNRVVRTEDRTPPGSAVCSEHSYGTKRDSSPEPEAAPCHEVTVHWCCLIIRFSGFVGETISAL